MQKPILAFLVTNFGIIDRGAEVSVYNLVKNLQSKYDIVIYARKRRPTDKTISSLLDLSKNIKIKRVISVNSFRGKNKKEGKNTLFSLFF